MGYGQSKQSLWMMDMYDFTKNVVRDVKPSSHGQVSSMGKVVFWGGGARNRVFAVPT